MHWRLRTFSVFGAATIECSAAVAAQVGIEPSDTSGARFKIVISGPINLATLVDFSRTLVDPRIAKTRAPTVELDSPGGSIPAAMAIGSLVRGGGLGAVVARQRACNSACALILVAGVERNAGAGSVSIHRPRLEAGRAVDPMHLRKRDHYDAVLADVRDYLKRMGPGDRLLDAMLAVPSNRMKALSLRELRTFGLSGGGSSETRMARIAHLSPSMDAISDASSADKPRKAARGKPLTPKQRLLRAIASGPPPDAWRVSTFGPRHRIASGKGALSRRHQKAFNVGRGARAPPYV
jgi:hypothetical protein